MLNTNLKGFITEINNEVVKIQTFEGQSYNINIDYTSQIQNLQIGDLINFDVEETKSETNITKWNKSYRIGINKFIILQESNKGIHIDLEEILSEIIYSGKLKLEKELFSYTHVFEKEIGISKLVTTSTEDNIIYAKYKNSKIYNKFVKDRSYISTNKVTLVLKKLSEEDYLLITAYYGDEAKMSIYDPKSDKDSIEFWKNKALIYEENMIDLKSITKYPKIKSNPKSFKIEMLRFIERHCSNRLPIFIKALLNKFFNTKFKNK